MQGTEGSPAGQGPRPGGELHRARPERSGAQTGKGCMTHQSAGPQFDDTCIFRKIIPTAMWRGHICREDFSLVLDKF